MIEHLWSFLAIVGIVLLALLLNSYVGASKWFAPAGSATI